MSTTFCTKICESFCEICLLTFAQENGKIIIYPPTHPSLGRDERLNSIIHLLERFVKYFFNKKKGLFSPWVLSNHVRLESTSDDKFIGELFTNREKVDCVWVLEAPLLNHCVLHFVNCHFCLPSFLFYDLIILPTGVIVNTFFKKFF